MILLAFAIILYEIAAQLVERNVTVLVGNFCLEIPRDIKNFNPKNSWYENSGI